MRFQKCSYCYQVCLGLRGAVFFVVLSFKYLRLEERAGHQGLKQVEQRAVFWGRICFWGGIMLFFATVFLLEYIQISNFDI